MAAKKGVSGKSDAFVAPFAESLVPLEKFVKEERTKLAPLEEKIAKIEDDIFTKTEQIKKAKETLSDSKRLLHSEDPSERISPAKLDKIREETAGTIAKRQEEIASLKEKLPPLKDQHKEILKAAVAHLKQEFKPSYFNPVREKVAAKDAKSLAEKLEQKDLLIKARDQEYVLLEKLTGARLTWHQRMARKCATASHCGIKMLRNKVSKERAKASKLLDVEERSALLFPFYETAKDIQNQIDALRADGEDRVNALKAEIKKIKSGKDLDRETKTALLRADKMQLRQATRIAKRHSVEVLTLIQKAELFLNEYYNQDYYNFIAVDIVKRRKLEKEDYRDKLAAAKRDQAKALNKLKALPVETYNQKQEKKVKLASNKLAYKNLLSEIKINHQKTVQTLKDEKHAAYIYKYHLIDLLRNSRFTFTQNVAQKTEMYGYSFKFTSFLLKYGLYIVIFFIFAFLCIWAPNSGKGDLLTMPNILEILSQSSPRTFLALGVAGLILLAGTDLSVGRMVSLGAIATSMIFHRGPNSIPLFGLVGIDFSGLSVVVRIILALVFSIGLCVLFTSLAGFFSAKFKMHPFITTLSTQLIIFGLVYYGTNGNGTGAIDRNIRNSLTPVLGSFPSIILWAIAGIFIVWLIWNKTKFGKHMYAVGGNPEAASVSGISVFAVTMGVFIMAGVLYGLGGFLEANRINGSASAVTGQGWELDAIAACVVGGISFSGGVGKIAGAVAGVIIFQALTYALSFMGIDTNLQFIFKGIIIMTAVAMDSVKYLKRK